MPFPAVILPLLISMAAAEEPPITVRGYPWAPFISPMGEPFRPPSTGEAPIARWFGKADQNRDGFLTLEEMQADADRFFAKLDGNHDGQIDREEMVIYETEIAPEVQVNSDWRRTRAQAASEARQPGQDAPDDSTLRRMKDGHDQHDGYQINGLQGAARYGVLNLPQPVAGADADFNRAVTLAEFRQAAANGSARSTSKMRQ